MSEHPLAPLFEPRSVGVIGASSDPEKRGHQVVAALRASGFRGPVHPVNPRGGEILGLPVARSIDEIGEPPDLVYVATPAPAVPEVVRRCGEAGVRGAIVPAVGFRESGDEGAALEEGVVAAARETGIRVIGPNTSGLLNTDVGLHMVGGEPLAPGAVAIVSQSGNVALDLMTAAASRPVGVSIYVGPGNECDVGFHEIVDYLAGHEPTRAIVMYVEGLKDGRALYETARSASTRKPIVVLKGGSSEDGVRAARSHTGALAGSARVFSAAARQSGMIEVERSDELFAVGEALALQPAPDGVAGAGDGFVVISDGGGHATLAADRFDALGVPLARLAPDTRETLRRLFGPAASVENPVDAAGAPDRDPAVLVAAFEAVVADPACRGVLSSGLFGGYAIRFSASLEEAERAAAGALAEAAARAGVPLVVHSLYERRMPAPLRGLLERGVPVHGSLEIAARCCAALSRFCGPDRAARRADATPAVPTPTGGDAEVVLSETESRTLVSAAGVSCAPMTLCRTEEDLRSCIEASPGPWAVKAVAPDLPHKTDAGGVRLGLADPAAVVAAFEDCLRSVRDYLTRAGRPADAVDGALVGPMLPRPVAEVLVGARRDPAFGPILALGLGGVDVELGADVAFAVLPIDRGGIDDMLRSLSRSPLLFGYRGAPPADTAALAGVALRTAEALLADESVLEIELNPVFAYVDGAIAVDALVRRRSRSR